VNGIERDLRQFLFAGDQGSLAAYVEMCAPYFKAK
jgi:hypothetical protein